MKRRIEIKDRDKYIKKEVTRDPKKADFYERWYAKFGHPQDRTMPGDEFMKRLQEMRDFE